MAEAARVELERVATERELHERQCLGQSLNVVKRTGGLEEEELRADNKREALG